MAPVVLDACDAGDAARASLDRWGTEPLASDNWDTFSSTEPAGSSEWDVSLEPAASSTWDMASTQPPAWDAQPAQKLDLTSNPQASEFPSTFTWTTNDSLTSTLTKCSVGSTTYLRGDEVGVGGYARVYKVLRQNDNRLFAGKMAPETQKLMNEARKLKIYTHQHLLRYEGWYAEVGRPETTMLLTELCGGGDLDDYINTICKAMRPGDILRVVAQISSALEYLRGRGVFHSDVKPKNIFIRSFASMDVVLGDCADIKPITYKGERLGTEGYYSPEMVRMKRHCGCADDVWALGVSVLGMMDQWPRVLYTREAAQKKYRRRIDKYPEECWKHGRDLERLNPGNGVVKLLGGMLAWGPQERSTAGVVKGVAEGLIGVWDGRERLDLIVPEGFEQIQFW